MMLFEEFIENKYNKEKINEEVDKSPRGKKLVNIFIGRFQPIHIEHIRSAKELFMQNGLPVVFCYVRASGNSGKGTDFSNKLIDKMFKEVTKNEKFIEDKVDIRFVAFDTQVFPALRPKYEPVLFGAGEDRYDSYQNQKNSMLVKHENKINMRPDFDIFLTKRELTGIEVSGTKVRESILNRDYESFKNMMPKYLWKFWDEMSSELISKRDLELELKEESKEQEVTKEKDDDINVVPVKTKQDKDNLLLSDDDTKIMGNMVNIEKLRDELKAVSTMIDLSKDKLENENLNKDEREKIYKKQNEAIKHHTMILLEYKKQIKNTQELLRK